MNGVEESASGNLTSYPRNKIAGTIKVPASSANLGPGFDSLGVALNLYLSVRAEESDEWKVTPLSKQLKVFPIDENNFICKVAIETARMYKQEMPPLKISVKSDIPLARGLGSSAAAIVAGIELADIFCGLQLGQKEKLKIGTDFEGHPDNVGACLFGGFVVGSQIGGEVDLTVLKNIHFEPVLVIPKEQLLTEASRDVLPRAFEYKRAVNASAISNQLLASFITENWELAGKMMSSDLFHQPYRKTLVPFYGMVEAKAISSGAFGVALSGAGPSVICLAKPGRGDAVAKQLQSELKGFEIHSLKIDLNGCRTLLEE
jgi:homoserine kinase